MYTRVFAIGCPICATNPSSLFILTHVEYVVVSVGPYKLHTCCTPVLAKILSTSSRFNGSPATLTTCTPAGIASCSSNVVITDGTVLMSVTSAPRPTKSSALETTQIQAPLVSGTKHS